jgi:hypothetical protein
MLNVLVCAREFRSSRLTFAGVRFFAGDRLGDGAFRFDDEEEEEADGWL